ncbi:MAG TPA: helix-turn-helix domain-containing protein [Chitinophagaceae bacterium]|nr:helix-turn-helix domain-containing protein [Chitinophagaceae bacterium]
MRNDAVKLGETLRQRRELLGIVQPQLSLLSGISTRTIQLIEQGKGNPSLETILQLADPLGLQLALLLKETDNKTL